MHRTPHVLSIAPDLVSQTYGHRRGAQRAPLAQALVWHHQVVEADHQPEASPVAGRAPGQTAGAAPQGSDAPPQWAIPAFHKSRLDGRAEWAQAPLLAKTARTAKHHAPADLHHLPSWVTDLDDLGVKELLGGDQPGVWLPPHLPPPSPTIDHAPNLEQRCALGFPAIREKHGEGPHAGDDRRHQRGGLLLRARTDVDPEQKPTAHRQGGMAPRHLTRTQFGMRRIQLDAGDVHLAYNLAMMGFSTLGSDPLQALHCFESHGTHVGGPGITDAPPLTLQPPY